MSAPAYAVVAGNPAQIIRFRFEPDIRTRLLAPSGWEWEDDEIWTLRSSFMADVESFLDDAERLRQPASESDVTRRLRETPVERVDTAPPDTGLSGRAANQRVGGADRGHALNCGLAMGYPLLADTGRSAAPAPARMMQHGSIRVR